jgi:hypothetical protein
MKKTILLLVSLAIISVAAWYAYQLVQNKGKSDTELIEFAIEDVSAVDKVIISDPFGRRFTIVKKGKEWTDDKGGCIVQESVEFILDAFKKIEFKGYLPDNSHERFQTLMASQHTKVEIFQNGEWIKTWYIGPSAQDHYGQVMLLDDKVAGKSDIPVLMKIRGTHGIIEPRFFADARKWRCTNIFSLELSDIAMVDLKFNDEPKRSFRVTKDRTNMHVYQQGKELSDVDTAMIFRYLHKYKKVHFDLPNYELSEAQVDSLKNTTPFCVLTVKETNGNQSKLRCFRIKSEPIVQADGLMQVEDIDQNKFWCELPNGELVKCQYFVFNHLFLGHVYFPLDLTGIKTHDGIIPKE